MYLNEKKMPLPLDIFVYLGQPRSSSTLTYFKTLLLGPAPFFSSLNHRKHVVSS